MKKDMATEQEKNITQMGNTIAKTIAEGFLPRVTTSNDDLKNVQNKCTSKRKLDDVDGHSSKCVSQYNMASDIRSQMVVAGIYFPLTNPS